MEIANTGERILLKKETPLMIARHFCAYRLSADFIRGRNVLEVGCGEGYGSYFLATEASSVTAVDYEPTVVDYASRTYSKPNLRFLAMDARNLGSLQERFSAVCSFQFIEHLEDADAFLRSVRALLSSGGIFICSTPNRHDASPGSVKPHNPFHRREYLVSEFQDLLKKYFASVELSGLKRGKKLNFYRRLKKLGICNLLPAPLDPVRRFYRQIDCSDFKVVTDDLETSLDFIAVCTG